MIKVDKISKKYGNKMLFDEFSVTFEKGKIHYIIGDSGKGKSTLLNMIGGIELADTGAIEVYGKSISNVKTSKNREIWKEISFLFQNYALIDAKTVEYNLKLGSGKISTEKMKSALEEVNLGDILLKKVYTLSGGEQQRVALARVLIRDTNVILADEPTGNLDKNNANIVTGILENLSKEKIVIVVTHNVALTQGGNCISI